MLMYHKVLLYFILYLMSLYGGRVKEHTFIRNVGGNIILSVIKIGTLFACITWSIPCQILFIF